MRELRGCCVFVYIAPLTTNAKGRLTNVVWTGY